MARQFKSKVVLVTGGGSGISRACALAFAKEKASVIVADISAKSGKETVGMIIKKGGEGISVKADISKAADVEALVSKAVDKYGRLDCAVNNAAIVGVRGPMLDCSEENWDKVIDTKLKGTWLCMKYEICQMLKHKSGAIVNIASTAGLVGDSFGESAYIASKHGVVGLTKAAALEYAKTGIRVNTICPGPTLTPALQVFIGEDPQRKAALDALVPRGHLADPEEIAEAVLWLCSNSASYVYGHPLAVDGGMVAQ
jgi:NAD(P)-dependent dehydrogenase (short-subunit alcohol dehydrogenase family)